MNFEELEKELKENHQFRNGCWFTDFSRIKGFEVLSYSTNGTSGIGYWGSVKVYFRGSHEGFKVEKYVGYGR